MSQTTHYNLNKPTGSNLVNPLVDTFPNWDIVDTEMYKNYNLGVSGATETVSQGVHAIVRTEADLPFFKFTAVANFSTGDTFTLDGVSVNVYTPDGLALKNGAFVSGATIIGYYNSSNHSVTLMLNTSSGAVANSAQLDGHDASYFAKASDITIIGNTDISAIGDGKLTGGLSAVDTKANNNNAHIGDLASLTTTNKDSTVDAINEVNTRVTQLNTDLTGYSDELITTNANGNAQTSISTDYTIIGAYGTYGGDAKLVKPYCDGSHWNVHTENLDGTPFTNEMLYHFTYIKNAIVRS